MVVGTRSSRRGTTPESYELQGLLRRMADGGCTHVVMEVSPALVQHRVEGLEFDAGVFINLTGTTWTTTGAWEAYRQAKGPSVPAVPEGGILNLGDPAGRWYGEQVECPAFAYSENKDAVGLTAKISAVSPAM